MSLSNSNVTHLPRAFLLLLAAHSLGWLFARLRRPRVAGEILGGLLLGPTASACCCRPGNRSRSVTVRPRRRAWGSSTSSGCCC
jgi:Kef-type K+ transport system membrane component KefB